MAKQFFSFDDEALAGKTFADVTVDTCRDIDNGVVSSADCVMTSLGLGDYILENPNVTTKRVIMRGHLTATPTAKFIVAFNPVDGDEAKESTLTTIAAYVDELETRLTALRAANLDNLDVAVSTRSAPATGNRLVTLTFYLTATVTPIQGIEVDIWNNGQTVKQNGQPLTTNSGGQITLSLNDGTYKVRPRKQGHTFTVPETLTVAGNTSQTYYGNTINIGVPLAVDACRVYEYCFMPDDQTPMATVKAKAKITRLPYDYNGKYHSGEEIDGTYNAATGVVYWDLVHGARVEFFIKDIHEEEVTKVIPSEVQKRLKEIA